MNVDMSLGEKYNYLKGISMKKKMLCSLLLMCMTSPVLSYTIGQLLTIENRTSKNLQLTIDAVNHQASIWQFIPAGSMRKIYTENGDNSGLLSQVARAPFKISDPDNHKDYIIGDIIFLVGGGYYDKHSFLDHVLSSKGVKLDLTYSCKNGGNGTVFQNKIVITGTPIHHMINIKEDKIDCKGLKTSTLEKNLTYKVTCSDHSQFEFNLYQCTRSAHGSQVECYWKSMRNVLVQSMILKEDSAKEVIDNNISKKTIKKIKDDLDKETGNEYCGLGDVA